MKLIIDYGNTFAKVALFQGDSIVSLKSHKILSSKHIEHFVEKNTSMLSVKETVSHCIISSVRNLQENIKTLLFARFQTIILDRSTPLPITVKYASPESLGNDRIALAVAASGLMPDNDILIIDAGTCITYDFINRNKEYFGGAISPGIKMRYKALNAFTDKLPLVNDFKKAEIIGNSTLNSIRSGVLNGVLFEVDGMIDAYKNLYPELKAIFTGGDLIYFDKNLKNNIFANSNLVLKGLNMILRYNVEE